MDNTLQARVDRSLDAAVFENEYRNLMDMSARELAVDLCTYDAGLEDEDVQEVTKCVEDYLAWYASHEVVPNSPRQQ